MLSCKPYFIVAGLSLLKPLQIIKARQQTENMGKGFNIKMKMENLLVSD